MKFFFASLTLETTNSILCVVSNINFHKNLLFRLKSLHLFFSGYRGSFRGVKLVAHNHLLLYLYPLPPSANIAWTVIVSASLYPFVKDRVGVNESEFVRLRMPTTHP